ncbi:hypothetical protein [Vagococcus proximus]|uniref:hypothetical protein n=1 Tax=Vagococcus proximus TaxID=2991417 RepID=UPI0023B8283D|nr:hypothetical protein [Vagococcus proximus]
MVNYLDINKLPPVQSLVQTLLSMGIKVTLISFGDIKNEKLRDDKNLKFIKLTDTSNNKFGKAIHFFSRKKDLKKIVTEQMTMNDILWTTTDLTVRELGDLVYRYKHVMHLMELIKDIPKYPYQNFFGSNLKKYAQKAYKVVVPEYNRAHIQKVWWELEECPSIFPNKPYSVNIENIPSEVNKVIRTMLEEKRKIILYQGVFRKERNLEDFAKAITDLNDEYVFYIMGSESLESTELLKKYPEVKHIPFIAPPYHLCITRQAYIGVLTYIPMFSKEHHISELNGVYCAPNKLYEYSYFGIPMIGNDVPGLMYPFEKFNMGRVTKLNSVDIRKTLMVIEKNYDELSLGCKEFYEDVSLSDAINEILS